MAYESLIPDLMIRWRKSQRSCVKGRAIYISAGEMGEIIEALKLRLEAGQSQSQQPYTAGPSLSGLRG